MIVLLRKYPSENACREFVLPFMSMTGQSSTCRAGAVAEPGDLADRSGNAAAGGVAADGEPIRVHAKLPGLIDHPLGCGVAVFQCGREFVLRSLPVIDRDGDAAAVV